ncbi:hypothetical protein R3I93_000948 [Phoxinus phoxinus]|uniref:Uncharacterized protein n=1 Tax=Phoxinus phoxinus TaxID=58324 RepID=A0AAN9HLF2_9TELE
MCETVVVKNDSSFYNIQGHNYLILSIERSTEPLHYQCTLSNEANCGLRLLLKENQGQDWSYHAVFVFNTLILLLSGIVNIFLCKRLRRTSESHAGVSDPSPPGTPPSDAASLNRVSIDLNYTTLQFPEDDDTSSENSAIERRKTRRNAIYSSLKCNVPNITEES